MTAKALLMVQLNDLLTDTDGLEHGNLYHSEPKQTCNCLKYCIYGTCCALSIFTDGIVGLRWQPFIREKSTIEDGCCLQKEYRPFEMLLPINNLTILKLFLICKTMNLKFRHSICASYN